MKADPMSGLNMHGSSSGIRAAQCLAPHGICTCGTANSPLFEKYILTTGWAIRKIPLPEFAYTTMVYAIGSVAGLWMIERLSGYWI